MATWHQHHRPMARHNTQWTVVTDPPGGFRSAMLFGSEQAALDHLAKGRQPHSYLLPPASDVTQLSTRFPSSWSKRRCADARATVAQLEPSWRHMREIMPHWAARACVTVKSRSNRYVATLHYSSDQGTGTVATEFESVEHVA